MTKGNENEIYAARDRFSGALQYALSNLKEFQDRKGDSLSPRKKSHNENGNFSGILRSPLKTKLYKKSKLKKSLFGPTQNPTYVLKLFDRTVDLAQFPEETSLYPLCRAWMKNNAKKSRPGSPESMVDKEWDSDLEKEEPSSELLIKKEQPITSMPSCIPVDVQEPNFVSPRIPILSEKSMENDYDIMKAQSDDAPSTLVLLGQHMIEWTKIRKSWKAAASKNELRFKPSIDLLKDMFEK